MFSLWEMKYVTFIQYKGTSKQMNFGDWPHASSSWFFFIMLQLTSTTPYCPAACRISAMSSSQSAVRVVLGV